MNVCPFVLIRECHTYRGVTASSVFWTAEVIVVIKVSNI